MRGVPPDRHCRVNNATGERSDNNLFLADAAVLKPHRDQSQNDRDQEKWRDSHDIAPNVVSGLPSVQIFIPPPGAKQDDNWQKHDLCL